MPDKQRELEDTHHPQAVAHRLDMASGTSFIADGVLGAIDGCVTTLAVISGAFGAGFSATVALVLGFANLIADGFSMAVSNYEAIRARQEHAESLRRTEAQHIDMIPAGEREELRQIFARKGFAGAMLENVVATISSDRTLWINTMLTEEYGIQRGALAPYRSGATTFGAFVVVGSVPLLPLLMNDLAPGPQFMASAALAGLMFFLVGSLKSLVFARPVFRSGCYTLMTGGAAAGLAYLTGYVLRALVGADAA